MAALTAQPSDFAETKPSPPFARYAWGVLAYTVLTVLWGAFVRASISGDGCGTHWPTCGGSLVPDFSQVKTIIEYSHRISSGLLLPLLIGMVVWGFRAFPKGHAIRKAVVVALVFVLIEAFIGAVLVKFELVARNDSTFRSIMMPIHLVNTFVLLGALSLAAFWASGAALPQPRGQGAIGFFFVLSVAAFIGLAVTGSLSALGDTIYPAASHLEVMESASLANAPLVISQRPKHPMTAASVSLVLCLMAGLLLSLRPSINTRRFAYAVWFGLTLQMLAGILNVILLAPPVMQLVHLFLADLLWIFVILLGASAFAVGVPHIELQHVPDAVLTGERATLKDYVALTKPRVISLLLLTTLAAMFIGAGGWPGTSFLSGLWLLIATGAGLYAAAGSSNAINMVMERDLDVRMERTATRPTVTEKIHPRLALWFALGLEIFSFGILWATSNLLAAVLALSGLVVYVIVYTLLLKRRTWSNIVIGGAAGAFPPLVGWAAAMGELSALAWVLFALVFVWTPVHFWALAILIKDDYAKAGVPMLPVVKGERYTVGQIGFYAIWTILASFTPYFLGAGLFYLGAALILNWFLVRGFLRLYQQVDRPRASGLFHYSMIYLALLFVALAIDKSLVFKI